MKIGLLRETRVPADSRVPLSPAQCRQAEDEFIDLKFVVQPSNDRCFSDDDYRCEGVTVSEDLSACDVLLGVKEVRPDALIPGKTYFFFSHTIKMQPHNKGLLQEVLSRKVRLIDYEVLTDSKGIRIIGFGRWAGMVGTYNGLRALCLRADDDSLPPPQEFPGYEQLLKQASETRLPPAKIALTGDGRVAGGAEEMLAAFGIRKVTVEEYLEKEYFSVPVYVQLDPSLYNRSKLRTRFNLKHFFLHPETYESNFGRFCSRTDLLIMAAYWDRRAPMLMTADDMRKPDFRISAIADITCDIGGSVPSTLRTTTFDQPYYDYNPVTASEEEAFSNLRNVTVMSIDNLPCGLPRDASADFGFNIMKSVIPILLGEDQEDVLGRATIAENGSLTHRYAYLADWVGGA